MSPIWTSKLKQLRNRQIKNKDRFKIKQIEITRTWAIGKIFLTEFVGVQSDQPAYFVQVYSVTTVYILEKCCGSCTGQGKLIECSLFLCFLEIQIAVLD